MICLRSQHPGNGIWEMEPFSLLQNPSVALFQPWQIQYHINGKNSQGAKIPYLRMDLLGCDAPQVEFFQEPQSGLLSIARAIYRP